MVDLTRQDEVVPSTINTDMFIYRTLGEVPYVARLSAISDDLLEEWRDKVTVDQRALCFTKP